jgi:SAM-dependent methyltransferase
MITKLDLGCGEKKREGFWGVDFCPGSTVDLVLNIESDRLPFEDNSIEHVFSSHTFEHLGYFPFVLQEIFRVCKEDALVEIWTPYGKSNDAFAIGHQLFLNETHWEQICYVSDRLFLAKSKGYFDWEKTQYNLSPGILLVLEKLDIPLDFALEHMFNIANEWGVFLRVKKNAERALGPQYPRKVFSYGRDKIIESVSTPNLTAVDFAQVKEVKQATRFFIDTINNTPLGHQLVPGLLFGSDETIRITGWAIDESAQKAAGGVFINVDGTQDLPAHYGLDRLDVAAALGNYHCRFAGFTSSISASSLKKGRHTLGLKVLTADKKGYYEADQKINIEIR